MKTRRDRSPKFRGADYSAPLPKPPRRPLRLVTVLKVIGVLVLLAMLWETLPSECKTRSVEVPRHCVD